MSTFEYFNAETAEERAARRARALQRTSGQRSKGGLTDAEADLLATLRRQGLAIEHGTLIGREGQRWAPSRVVTRAEGMRG